MARITMPRTAPVALLAATLLHAAASLAAETPPPVPAVSAGSMLQMLLGLAVVLGVVLAFAWIMKRFASQAGSGAGAIKVVAGVAVGQRERLVLVEVAGTWLVVGVAPGRVSAVHAMPRGELPDPAAATGPAAPAFADWLKRRLEQRHAG